MGSGRKPTGRAAAHADEAVALSVEHGLAGPEHRARFFQGALLAQNGDPQHGIELMRNAIAASTAMLASGNHLSLVSHEDVFQAPSIQIGNPKSEIRNEDGLIQLWDLGFGSGDFLGRAWL